MDSTDGVDKDRRRMLAGATSAACALGAAGLTIPFIKSWTPSSKAKAAGAPVKADISNLQPGKQMIVEWRGKPVWIVHRTASSLQNLESNSNDLADPQSIKAIQPDYIPIDFSRSLRPEIIVMVGLCTHFGCSPTYRPEIQPADLGPEWKGGFFCPCHSSRFDLSGRVFSKMPATRNLAIPPHYYINETVILIGEDGERQA
jgi:ubiquinol-cytochrome c reductase iron-sulfur subunit